MQHQKKNRENKKQDLPSQFLQPTLVTGPSPIPNTFNVCSLKCISLLSHKLTKIWIKEPLSIDN